MILSKEFPQTKRTPVRGTHPRQRFQNRPAVEPLEQRCMLSADMVVQWNQIAIQAAVNDYSLAPCAVLTRPRAPLEITGKHLELLASLAGIALVCAGVE